MPEHARDGGGKTRRFRRPNVLTGGTARSFGNYSFLDQAMPEATMNCFAKRGILAFLPIFLLYATFSLHAVAADVPAQPESIVVFGDSLSDTGNVFEATLHAEPPSPPYFDGRFSNGPVWVELLAGQFGLDVRPALSGGTNYAVGGAKVRTGEDSIEDQVRTFLAGRGLSRLSDSTLFVVFGGGNDLTGAAGSTDPAGIVTDAATGIQNIVEELAGRGAVNFLVPNLPNTGSTPDARSHGATGTEQALSTGFNAALDALLEDTSARLGINIIRVDLFGLLENAVTMPAMFGFSDIVNPCLVPQEGGNGFTVCSDPGSHLFWDDIHPTARGHQFIAGAAVGAYRLAAGTKPTSDSGMPTVDADARSFQRNLLDRIRSTLGGLARGALP
ncbi:MAG TPA: SGNH/GDSL hydrolase family protein [Stellaceae bacterium]